MKTTVIIATYPEDTHINTAYKRLLEIGYPAEYIKLVDSSKKHTFAENNNKGAKDAKTKYILFLNSDTLPEQGFIEAMENVLESNENFGIVGAKLYFVEDINRSVYFKKSLHSIIEKKNTIQHAGIHFNKQFLPIETNRGYSMDYPDVNESRITGAVTGACMMVRREEFLQVLFDENFKNGWEDTDFCLRFLEKFKKLCVYQPKAVVGHYHSGGHEYGRFNDEDANYNYWVEKWIDSGRIYKLFFPHLPQENIRLDIGCGTNKKEGFFCIDNDLNAHTDLIFNLETISDNGEKLPFGISTVDEIHCSHVLEYLENAIETINEFHRILKTEGWLTLVVSHAFSWSGFASPFTKKYFVPETFLNYFKADTRVDLIKTDPRVEILKPWHIETLEFTPVPRGVDQFSIQREIKVVMRPLK